MESNETRRGNRTTVWIIVLGTVAVVLLIAFVATALATDRPSFCPTCHDMQPYYDAWAVGPHKNVWCIDCHVNAGIPNRLFHKFEALGEVASQLRGDTSFPRPAAAVVPDRRCLRCHPTPGKKNPTNGFDHAMHQKVLPCQQCHANTGHNVTDLALQQAGVFDPQNAAQRAVAMPPGKFAAPGAGKANLKSHPQVICSNCHDMAATPCKVCHTAGHPARTDCTTCHQPPPNHFGPNCGQCHVPGTSFKNANFNHPPIPGGQHTFRSFPCVKCHPQGPPKPSCTCHGGGIFQGD